MTKTELIDSIATKAGLTKKDSAAALEATLNIIACTIANGEPVTIVGFGAFTVSERAAREGINPLTKAAIKIPASKGVKFKPGKALKDAVN